MIKSRYFPGKSYATKEELFADLRSNASKIIACKKAEIYHSCKKLMNENGESKFHTDFALKTDGEESKVGPQMKEGYIYPVINSTNIFDSHKDVHFPGIWDKSHKDQAGKIYYVADHKIETGTIIAWPEDVKMLVKTVPWSWLGKNWEGNSQVLMYEINKSSIVNENARRIIEEKRPVQNSVRMQYVSIKLGMNSTNDADKECKEYYDRRIGEIVNRDEVEECGFFFGIEEAKIIREGSMVPLGSNPVTPINQKDDVGTPASENKDKPANPATSQTETKQFINPNLY